MQRILAIDYGAKRIGLALSDPLGYTSQPLPFFLNSSFSKLVEYLNQLILNKSIDLIVVGLPKSLDGTLGERALEIVRISEKIQEKCKVSVELYDERFTTREAEDFLIDELNMSRKKRKQYIDSLSACYLLESYKKSKEFR